MNSCDRIGKSILFRVLKVTDEEILLRFLEIFGLFTYSTVLDSKIISGIKSTFRYFSNKSICDFAVSISPKLLSLVNSILVMLFLKDVIEEYFNSCKISDSN